jgi:hypothetical protein
VTLAAECSWTSSPSAAIFAYKAIGACTGLVDLPPVSWLLAIRSKPFRQRQMLNPAILNLQLVSRDCGDLRERSAYCVHQPDSGGFATAIGSFFHGYL